MNTTKSDPVKIDLEQLLREGNIIRIKPQGYSMSLYFLSSFVFFLNFFELSALILNFLLNFSCFCAILNKII